MVKTTKDKYLKQTNNRMYVNMNKNKLITHHAMPGGLVVCDGGIYEKQGGVTIRQVFSGCEVISF